LLFDGLSSWWHIADGQNGQVGPMRSWQVQEAKARFSDLLRDAARSGPQRITVRGRAAAVVLSSEDYERLRSPKPPLVEFLRTSPLAGTELDLERDRSAGRDIDL
jgi:prevent-host-death family protein